MNYGKQAISVGPTCRGGRTGEGGGVTNGGWIGGWVSRSDSRKKCSQWDDKSNFRSGCTEPWPIVAFYMQSRVKLWRGKGGGGRILRPGSDHCATCWPEASLYYYCREQWPLFKCISPVSASRPATTSRQARALRSVEMHPEIHFAVSSLSYRSIVMLDYDTETGTRAGFCYVGNK